MDGKISSFHNLNSSLCWWDFFFIKPPLGFGLGGLLPNRRLGICKMSVARIWKTLPRLEAQLCPRSHMERNMTTKTTNNRPYHPWIINTAQQIVWLQSLSGGSDHRNGNQFLMSSGARIGNQLTSHTALPSSHPKIQVFQLPPTKHKQ